MRLLSLVVILFSLLCASPAWAYCVSEVGSEWTAGFVRIKQPKSDDKEAVSELMSEVSVNWNWLWSERCGGETPRYNYGVALMLSNSHRVGGTWYDPSSETAFEISPAVVLGIGYFQLGLGYDTGWSDDYHREFLSLGVALPSW